MPCRSRLNAGSATVVLLIALQVGLVAPVTACSSPGGEAGRSPRVAIDGAAGAPVADSVQSGDERGGAPLTGDHRFVQRGDDWFVASAGQLYRIQPRSLSLRFTDDATAAEREEFLAARGFEVVRRNRLGILDVRTPPGRHAVEWFGELSGNRLLDLVDVNTEGSFEERE